MSSYYTRNHKFSHVSPIALSQPSSGSRWLPPHITPPLLIFWTCSAPLHRGGDFILIWNLFYPVRCVCVRVGGKTFAFQSSKGWKTVEWQLWEASDEIRAPGRDKPIKLYLAHSLSLFLSLSHSLSLSLSRSLSFFTWIYWKWKCLIKRWGVKYCLFYPQ